jgi:ADP-ribose pyrophosphatase
MLKRWKKLSTKVIYRNPWWTYKLDAFEIPDRFSGEYHYIHTNGSSMVIPLKDKGKMILVNQFRYLCDRESLEFPCGSVKDGKSYLETAHMELEEETGYQANIMEFIGEFNPYNGVTSEICKVFLAHQLHPTMTHPDETEEFEWVVYTPEEMDVMIGEKRIWDGMTLAAWMLGRYHILKSLDLENA